jgi:hypothetical protein
MAGTYKLIGSVTVGAGGQAAIEFTSIPATYTDLLIKLSGRSSRSGAPAEEFLLTFNNDTSSIYTERHIRGNGTAVISQTFASYSSITQVGQSGAGATANTFASWDIYIPNYAGSNNKSILLEGVTENNSATAGNALTYFSAGLWANSAAITSIKLSAGSYLAEQYSTAYLYGIEIPAQQITPKATGGDITFNDTHVFHTFRQSGTFTPLQSLTADTLVVAGGGGAPESGGGGAGGLRQLSSQSLTATAYTITVGAGGSGTTSGSNSSMAGSGFSTITATGGGKSGDAPSSGWGYSGGSGGGGAAGGNNRYGGSGNAGSYSPVEGYAGGDNGNTASPYPAGGGGGAGAVGGTGAGSASGAGGIGATSSLINAMGAATLTGQLSGGNYYYAGGGGGGAAGGTKGAGGLGGGGAGDDSSTSAVAGTVNTGGGAGGNRYGTLKGGGSGIVIVRYLK